MRERILTHLKQQYAGVFTDAQITQHLDNYVGDQQSTYLTQKIGPFVTKETKILDVGSGYGSFVLAARAQGWEAFGLEIALFEHEIAQERARAQQDDPMIFRHGSALAIPFANQTFDIITFWNVIEHIPDYKKALLEAKRILKPGGKIFIIAPNYGTFRIEAHYHLMWLPLFPKWLAQHYLKLRGRDPTFLLKSVFYVTSFGVKRYLKKLNFKITLDAIEKIKIQYTFQSNILNKILKLSEFLNVKSLLVKILYFLKTHPLVHSIDIIAQHD